MTRLTEEYVLAKTRQAELAGVRNLNLWGNGIEDISVRSANARLRARVCTVVPHRRAQRCALRAADGAAAAAPQTSGWRSAHADARRGPARADCEPHAQPGGAVPLRQQVRGSGGASCRRSTSERAPGRRASLAPPARRVSTLRDLAGCAALQELYLRKNEIAELAEVRHLRHCHALRVLWLCDNPCAAAADYRARCVQLR